MTAVGYLVEELERIGFSTHNIVEFENEVQIAKEMFEQQIIDAFTNGDNYNFSNGEQYYNEKFNK